MWQPAINTQQRQKSAKDNPVQLGDHTQLFLLGGDISYANP